MRFENGMPANMIPGAEWIKSSASTGGGNCVEVTGLPDGGVALRNSRYPQGPALIYTREEIAAFITGIKAAEFDHLGE